MPHELASILGGIGIYLLFTFFGPRHGPPLRKSSPNPRFGGAVGFAGLAVLLLSILVSAQADTPIRELEKNRDLPKFLRWSYGFSFVLMSSGCCEVVRSLLGSPGRRRRYRYPLSRHSVANAWRG